MGRFALGPGRYVVIPSTFEPNVVGKYLLRIYADSLSSSKEMIKVKPTKKFWSKYPVGALRVQVAGARGLEKVSVISGADPYAVVSVSGNKSKTPTLKGTVNPDWNNSSHIFYVSKPHKTNVTVFVYSQGLIKDTLLGKVKFNINEYIKSGNQGKEFVSTHNLDSGKGNVTTSIIFIPNILEA